MKRALQVLFAALAAAAVVPASQSPPAAVVVRVQGEVQLRSGVADPVPATVGVGLSSGDQLLPAAGAQAVVVHRSGRTQVVREPATIAVAEGEAQGDMFTRTVRVFAQAASSDARRTGNRQGMIRPLPGGAAPIAPRNGLKVRSTRPTLSWFAVPGASAYRVQLRREGGELRRFDAGRDTVLVLPPGEELLRGASYHWTVAPEGGRPVLEQSFMVAGADELVEVEGAFAGIRRMGLDPAGDGLLLLAVVYTDLGLLYEAADAIAELERGGSLSTDVLLLKGEVLDALGRFDEARAAFDQAGGTPR